MTMGKRYAHKIDKYIDRGFTFGPCPKCGAETNQPCRSRNGNEYHYHESRSSWRTTDDELRARALGIAEWIERRASGAAPLSQGQRDRLLAIVAAADGGDDE